MGALELHWPLDRWDYLTVCDNHPTPYYSNAAKLVDEGEQESDDTILADQRVGWGWRRSSFRAVRRRSGANGGRVTERDPR
jgi:hypothetical protein